MSRLPPKTVTTRCSHELERARHASSGRLEEQGSVGATEPEGAAQGGAYIDLARGIRDVIQVTLGIGMLVVDGGRQHPMAER